MSISPLCKYLRNFFLVILSFCNCFCEGTSPEITISNTYDPVALYLTWQRSPESTMTINWITTPERKSDDVQFREIDTEKWQEAAGSHNSLPEDTPYFLHRVELLGLQPATIYEFRTGNDAVAYKFQTMPANLNKPIRFVAGGDVYHDSIEFVHATNIQAAKTGPDFALIGGDIAYASTKFSDWLPRWVQGFVDHLVGQKFDRWLTWLIAWKDDMVRPDGCLIPILPAIGNHDVVGRYGQTPEKAPFFYSLFPMPGKHGYNVLDFSDYMSIFLLDSGHTNAVGGKQAQWLASAMQQREAVPHKFALYHVPAYPSVHGLKIEVGAQIRKFWVPSFDAYHLTAAFENHEHAYKRTHPLRGNAIDEKGVMYIGDGSWGVEHPRTPRHLDEKWYLAKAASVRQFLLIDVEKDKQTVYGISSDGMVIDSFSWPTHPVAKSSN
ncbi:MAG TPA: metallophosphoesterase family protein [Parachlamydiaceae bacterium]|nr:metallophosphoesterase family protein [Parachlamydiaceae bacterium]